MRPTKKATAVKAVASIPAAIQIEKKQFPFEATGTITVLKISPAVSVAAVRGTYTGSSKTLQGDNNCVSLTKHIDTKKYHEIKGFMLSVKDFVELCKAGAKLKVEA